MFNPTFVKENLPLPFLFKPNSLVTVMNHCKTFHFGYKNESQQQNIEILPSTPLNDITCHQAQRTFMHTKGLLQQLSHVHSKYGGIRMLVWS